MTQTQLSSFQLDWFNALHYALPTLRESISTLAREVEILPGDPTSVWIGKWEVVKDSAFGTPDKLRLFINIDPALPEIERIEMNLALVSLAHWKLQFGTYGDDSERRLDLCRRLGCWPEVLNQPSVRWRLLAYRTNLHELSYIGLENRIHCSICPGRIATGDSALHRVSIEEALLPNSHRKDLHYECWKYLHHVLAPQIRAMRRKAVPETNPKPT